MKKYPPQYGQTSNRIPYVKFGSGRKILLLFMGGPGNILPMRFTFSAQASDFYPLCEKYTVFMMTRKIGLSLGDSTETMARDYANMIKSDFGGHVDAIIGYSYGGLIVQHFVADYPELCEKVIILSATNENKEQGKAIDEQFAQYLIEGKKGKAFALMMDVLMEPGITRGLMKFLMRSVGPFIPLMKYLEFIPDMKLELEAELTHDASSKYQKITIPLLILIGTEDYYFSVESAKRMAEQIINARLVILDGGTHEITKHSQFLQNIKNFLEI